MIQDIEFSTEPIAAGESRPIRVVAKEPIAVHINCFVKRPPPPSFRPCPECGSFRVPSGEQKLIKVSGTAFRKGGGTLIVSVRDADGDKQEFKLEVVRWDKPETGGKTPPSTINVPGSGGESEPAEVEFEEMGWNKKSPVNTEEGLHAMIRNGLASSREAHTQTSYDESKYKCF